MLQQGCGDLLALLFSSPVPLEHLPEYHTDPLKQETKVKTRVKRDAGKKAVDLVGAEAAWPRQISSLKRSSSLDGPKPGKIKGCLLEIPPGRLHFTWKDRTVRKDHPAHGTGAASYLRPVLKQCLVYFLHHGKVGYRQKCEPVKGKPVT